MICDGSYKSVVAILSRKVKRRESKLTRIKTAEKDYTAASQNCIQYMYCMQYINTVKFCLVYWLNEWANKQYFSYIAVECVSVNKTDSLFMYPS